MKTKIINNVSQLTQSLPIFSRVPPLGFYEDEKVMVTEGFFHSKSIRGCAALKGILFQTLHLGKGIPCKFVLVMVYQRVSNWTLLVKETVTFSAAVVYKAFLK